MSLVRNVQVMSVTYTLLLLVENVHYNKLKRINHEDD